MTAGRDGRIQSVWPFLVREVLAFGMSLSPREQANFDPEDIITELWVKLAQKDHKWSPERGRYISFAGAVVETELARIRDRTRTVKPPGNSAARMREYAEKEEAGTLSEREALTRVRLQVVMTAPAGLGGTDRNDGGEPDYDPQDNEARPPDGSPTNSERAVEAKAAVLRVLRALDEDEAAILAEAHGLFGREARTPAQIAASRRRGVKAIREILSLAEEKARRALEAAGEDKPYRRTA